MSWLPVAASLTRAASHRERDLNPAIGTPTAVFAMRVGGRLPAPPILGFTPIATAMVGAVGTHRISLIGQARFILAALASCAAVAGVLAVMSVPASASSTRTAGIGSDWAEQTLPAGYSIGGSLPGNPMAPVSCVTGTTFCAVIANDDATPPPGQEFDNQAVFVSTGGTAWTTSGDLPAGYQYQAISCPTVTTCYVVGDSESSSAVSVAVSTDGGQTWNPTAGAPSSALVNSIDCVSVATCYVAYGRGGANGIAYTGNGGTTWTGGYESESGAGIYDVTCAAAGSPCVAVGGTNNENGGQAIVLTGSGFTWQPSTSPVLSEISILFGVSCAANGSGTQTCYAVGASDNSSDTEGGPVELISTDGGQTWTGTGFVVGTGWLNSVSCADASDCWAGGAGTQLALAGTSDGGATWYPETVTDTNQLNFVSCASVDFCVATADNALWTTTDDGGIATQPPPSPSITEPLPPITPPSVATDSGKSETVTGQDRMTDRGTSVSVSIRLPDGHIARSTVRTSTFFFYSLRVNSLPIGATHVSFAIGGRTVDTVKIQAARTGSASPARITSAKRATFKVGKRFSFTVKVQGSPHPWLWETGKLPRGVTFDTSDGRLSGVPARHAAGTYRITFTATNGAGRDAVQHFVLTISS